MLDSFTAQRWVGVVAAILLIACMGEVDDLDEADPVDVIAEEEAATATPQGEPAAPDEKVGITAGCTHIVWCNEPGPAEVVCDTVDQACSCTDRVFECRGDADAVCGTGWHNMRFDPPICGSPGIVQ